MKRVLGMFRSVMLEVYAEGISMWWLFDQGRVIYQGFLLYLTLMKRVLGMSRMVRYMIVIIVWPIKFPQTVLDFEHRAP